MPKTTKSDVRDNTVLAIRPLLGYLVIAPDKAESKTAGGLYLPETAQERPAQGKVLAIGDRLTIDGRPIEIPVKVGDRVIYKKWGGDEIKYNGVEYKLVKFEDLMAVIED